VKGQTKTFQAFIFLLVCFFGINNVFAAKIDWQKIKKLQDGKFLDYVNSLDLKGQEALGFWKKIPLSKANKQVNKIFRKESFKIYMNNYPQQRRNNSYFKVGMGTDITGPMSGQKLKLPFTHLYPLKKGPIGDPQKVYRVGYTIHGFGHPWLLNNADSAMWEASRHPNVKLTVLDPEFDNQKQVLQIDDWIGKKMDGIMIWPMQEAPTGPPVKRASAKGIPTVSVDRMVGTRKISSRITGNFPANGTQQGMYLVHRLLQEKETVEGTILMIRKPLGSTADAQRTGNFLRVISYFPKLKILGSHHNASNRKTSYNQVQQALKKHKKIDAIFCTGAEQSMGAVLAVDAAKRWNSRDNNHRIIILNNDDLHEALLAIQEDKIAMTAPYTPLLGALGMRILLKIIAGEKIPQDVVTPDLPMITKKKENVFGLITVSVEEWTPYTYGRK
jgi:ribose transport system substrate-binding protein